MKKIECRKFTFWIFLLVNAFYTYQACVDEKIAFLAFSTFAAILAFCVAYSETLNLTIRGNAVEKEIDVYVFNAIFMWIGYQYLSEEEVLTESLSFLLMTTELLMWIYIIVGVDILLIWISKNALINIHIRLFAKILSVQIFLNNGLTNSKQWINAMFFLAFVYYFIELKRFFVLSDLTGKDEIASKELANMELMYCILGILIELMSFLDREALQNLALHPIQTMNIPIWLIGMLGAVVVLRITVDKDNLYEYCLVGDILLFIVYYACIQMQYIEDEAMGLVGFVIACLIIDRVIKKIYTVVSWESLWKIILSFIISIPIMLIITQSFAKFNYMVMLVVAILYIIFEVGEKKKGNTAFCCRIFCIISFPILILIAVRSSYIQYMYILLMVCTAVIAFFFIKVKQLGVDTDRRENCWKEASSKKKFIYAICVIIPLVMAFKISILEKDYLHIEYATQKVASTKKSNTIGRIYGLEEIRDLQIAWDDQEPKKIEKEYFNVKVKGKVLTVTVKDKENKEHIYKHYYHFY